MYDIGVKPILTILQITLCVYGYSYAYVIVLYYNIIYEWQCYL